MPLFPHWDLSLDLPASRLAAGVPGEELPRGPEGAGGQLLRPICNTGGGEKGGSDPTGGDPSGQRGDLGIAWLQSHQALFAGKLTRQMVCYTKTAGKFSSAIVWKRAGNFMYLAGD